MLVEHKVSRLLGRRLGIILPMALLIAALAGHLAVSLAQGTSVDWTIPEDMASPMGREGPMEFPVLVVDRWQNVHMFWGDRGAPTGALYYTNDIGGAWAPPRDVVVSPSGLVIRIISVIDQERDVIHVVWSDAYLGGALYYTAAPLAEAGDWSAWRKPVPIAWRVTRGAMAVDSGGVLHLVYGAGDASGTENAIYHLFSDSGGLGWDESSAIATFRTVMPCDVTPFMVADDGGRLHIGVTLRSLEYGLTSEVGYLRSADNGVTWDEYRQFDAGGSTFQGVSTMAPFAFGQDEIHLTWHNPDRLHVMSQDGGVNWGPAKEINRIPAGFGGANELAKDSLGRLFAVTAEGGGVYVSQYQDGYWGNTARIDDRAIDPHGQHLVISQGNKLHVAYYDRVGPGSVWYSSRRVDAPQVEQMVMPTLVPSSTPLPSSTPTATREQGPGAGLQQTTQPPSLAPHIEQALAPAMVPVVTLLGIFALIRKRWSK